MVNRVVLGNKNGAMGMWVSKPGWDVLTAPENQMLFSTTRKPFMVMGQGVVAGFTGVGQVRGISIPDYGFYPMFAFSCEGWALRVQFYSTAYLELTAVARFNVYTKDECYYAFFNEAFYG